MGPRRKYPSKATTAISGAPIPRKEGSDPRSIFRDVDDVEVDLLFGLVLVLER